MSFDEASEEDHNSDDFDAENDADDESDTNMVQV